MLQLQILSGSQAGAFWSARRFPVRVGRSPGNELQLIEAGVWDQHFELDLNAEMNFVLKAHGDARIAVNQQSVRTTRLRNGDIIEFGSMRVCFRLGDTRQSGLWLREWLVWALVVAISLSQIVLVYWLWQ